MNMLTFCTGYALARWHACMCRWKLNRAGQLMLVVCPSHDCVAIATLYTIYIYICTSLVCF